jgi:lysophospholipase L1-like esterase
MSVKFYLFGDSICFGQLVSHNLTWISSLSSRLSEILSPEKDVLIQNASINGNTTRQALELVHGIGEKRAARYGAAFLDVIRTWLVSAGR